MRCFYYAIFLLSFHIHHRTNEETAFFRQVGTRGNILHQIILPGVICICTGTGNKGGQGQYKGHDTGTIRFINYLLFRILSFLCEAEKAAAAIPKYRIHPGS